MKQFCSTSFIIQVSLFSTLTQSIFAVLNKNFLETKYIEDICSSEKDQELDLSINGTASAIRIESKNENTTTEDCSCAVVIKSLDGVILHFVSTQGVRYVKDSDSIQIFPGPKNSSKLIHHEASHVFKRTIRLKFSSEFCLPGEKIFIISTAYRQGNGFCIEEKEFKCDTGECVRKKYFCDGTKNCPDGSDELLTKNCISRPNIDLTWNIVFPTSKSIVEYRKSFSYSITSAVACAFVIFVFGVLRLVCYYHCAQRQTQRQPQPQRPFATITTFSIIRQRPDYRPEYQCPPPPSYVSLIRDTSNNASNGNPPAYSSVVPAEDTNQTEANRSNANDNGHREPPPPYKP